MTPAREIAVRINQQAVTDKDLIDMIEIALEKYALEKVEETVNIVRQFVVAIECGQYIGMNWSVYKEAREFLNLLPKKESK